MRQNKASKRTNPALAGRIMLLKGPCDVKTTRYRARTADDMRFCGVIDECRPYGPNGENICFDCGMKDEKITKRRFIQHIHGEGFDD